MSPQRTATQGTPEALEEDLTDVAQRRLTNCFLQADDADEWENFPTLASVVKGLVDNETWRRSPRAAVIDVVRRALDDVPEFFTGRRPEQDRGRNEWGGKPERHIAELLYGYRDGEIKVRYTKAGNKAAITYARDYYPAAVELLGEHLAKKSIGRALRVVRQDLARALLELRPEDIQAQHPPIAHQVSRDDTRNRNSTLASLQANQPTYVRRDSYHTQFDELVNADQHIIVFEGDRGNGKTRLSLEMISERNPDEGEFAYLFSESATTLVRDLKALFASRGQEVKGSSLSEMAAYFAEVVCGDRAPSWVILDNVEDPELVDQLLPPNMQSRVIITASVGLPIPSAGVIHVDPLEDRQSHQLIHSLLPKLASEDVTTLAGPLGGRVLAIVHVCGFILAERLVSVDEFVEDLRRDAAGTLDAPEASVRRTLAAIYRQTFARLRGAKSGEVGAAHLLELVAFLAPSSISADILYSALRARVPAATISMSQFQGLLNSLRARFLVRQVADTLAIQPLTQEILRSLLHERRLEICLALHRPVLDAITRVTIGRPLDSDSIRLLPHAARIVRGMDQFDPNVNTGVNLGRVIAFVMRGLHQTGDLDGHRILIDDVLNEFDFDRLLFPELREGTIEWVLLGRSGGYLPPWMFATILDDLSVSVKGRAEPIYRNSVRLMVEYSATLKDCGLCEDAIDVLLAERSWAMSNAIDDVEIADFNVVLGEAYHELAHWDEAEASLKEAMAIYAAQEDEAVRVHGIIRAFRSLADNDLCSGKRKVDQLLRTVDGYLHLRKLQFHDKLSDARLKRTLARVVAHGFFAALALHLGRGSEDLPEAIGDSARSFFKGWRESQVRYVASGSFVESHDLDYDMILVSAVAAGELVGVIENPVFADSGELRYDMAGRVSGRAAIAEVKIALMYFPESTAFCAMLVEYCKRLAYRFAADAESPYWYCSALAAACVAAAISGLSFQYMLQALMDGYQQIGRPDRWRDFVRVIRAAVYRDKDSFRRFYPTLLCW